MFRIGDDLVALVTDTACDLSDEQLAAYDIRTISLRVNTSSGEKRDRLEITQEELYELLKHEVPKTSLPLPEDVSNLYEQLKAEGCTRILHVSMSSGLSGTYNMACILAEDMEGIQVDVFDSKTLSAGLGLLVLSAGEALAASCTVEETIERLGQLRIGQSGCFVIRTLEFLRKGGRIGAVEGMLGSLLQIKPVIYVDDDGVYQTLVKARGYNGAVDAMCKELYRRYEGRPVRLAVVHGNAYEDAEKLLKQISEHLQVVDSYIAPVSPALAIHTGPGLVGAIVQQAN